jgi:hypothetical protein
MSPEGFVDPPKSFPTLPYLFVSTTLQVRLLLFEEMKIPVL